MPVEISVYADAAGLEAVVALEHRSAVVSDVPLVRIHSACFTGDVLGSLFCDCGVQLAESLVRITTAPWGILLYLLRHEGRGIGLTNKIRAYRLQQQGLDTIEANVALGFPPDLRSYEHAASVLCGRGAVRVRLLTNNPRKAAALVENGVDVCEQVPLVPPANPFNRGYLHDKRVLFGHLLPET